MLWQRDVWRGEDTGVLLLQEMGFHIVENLVELLIGGGLEHGYACFSEVWNAFEKRRCRKVSPDVQNASILVDAVNALGDLPAQKLHFVAV